jgi:hypothetical protein
MSEGNVEPYRRLAEKFNARDIEGMIALSDPRIEFHSTFAAVGGAVYHGHDGMRNWHRDLLEAWGEEIDDLEIEAYFGLGEHTPAFGVLRGRGQQSEVEVAMPVAQVGRWRQGLVNYFKSYSSRADALRDLGVSEDELEPIAP